MQPAHLMIVYGSFLMLCGITAVIFIGFRAKTALMSGGFAAFLSLGAAYFYSVSAPYAPYTGIFVSSALVCVFAWRSTKTLHAVFELIPEKAPELKGKGTAFLIISLMAIISVFVSFLQIMSIFID